MRKFLMLPLAGLLVIGGATAVLAGSDTVGDAVGDAVEETTSAVTSAGSLLADVLADLVADGTIDQTQADAIVDAVDTRIEEKRAEMAQLRELIQGFLEDGVITSEELEQLPEDHPWRNLDDFLADGQLTVEELRQLAGPLGRGGHGHRGFGHGPGSGGPGGFWAPLTGDDSNDNSDSGDGAEADS